MPINNPAYISTNLITDTIEVSSAEVLQLFTTPKTLIAAAGADKVIIPIRCVLSYDWNTVAYTLGAATNLAIQWQNYAQNVFTLQAVNTILNQVNDIVVIFLPIAGNKIHATNLRNDPIILMIQGANVTLGNSPLHVHITYFVSDAGL